MAIPAITLVLAAILAVSGTAKLGDLRGSAATLTGFSVPRRFVSPLAVALPLLELTVAAALLPAATAEAATIAATALFSIFSIFLAATLLRGRRPDCGCFGKLHSAPIGWSTLARAAGLAAVAAFLAVAGTGDGVSVLAGQPVAWLAAVTGGQSILLVAVLRRHGRTLARIDALEATPGRPELARGTMAPEFTLPDLAGELVSLAQLRSGGQPSLVVFGNPSCGPCTALLPGLARWQKEYPQQVTVALVTRGDAVLNRAHAQQHGLELVLLQRDDEIAEAYGAHSTPAAVLVAPDGRIEGPLRYGASGVEALFAQALEHSPAPADEELETGRASNPRFARAAAGATGAIVAGPARAASVDDEDDAIRELRRILRVRNPQLRRDAQRVAAKTRKLFNSPRSASTKFELVAAIALAKKEIGRAMDELESVPVPDYRPGEKGARIAKSRAISSLSYLNLVLDRYAKGAQTSRLAELERLDEDIVRFTVEAEKNRRLASKLLGCTRKLENC